MGWAGAENSSQEPHEKGFTPLRGVILFSYICVVCLSQEVGGLANTACVLVASELWLILIDRYN